MRRYFDEYRGLRESDRPRRAVQRCRAPRASVARRSSRRPPLDGRAQDPAARAGARWPARVRPCTTAGGGSSPRSARAPSGCPRRCSGRSRSRAATTAPRGAARPPGAGPRGRRRGRPRRPTISAKLSGEVYDVVARVWRDGPAPLLDPVPGMAERERLRLAMVIPPFTPRQRRAQHAVSDLLAPGAARPRLQRLARRLLRLRHATSGRRCCATKSASTSRPSRGPSTRASSDWQGADVAIATGWQTVHAMLELDRCRARAYVVNDHEPEFFPASAERALSADTYRHGLHCIAASPWLRDLLTETLRHHAPRPSSWASTTTPTSRGRSSAGATRSSTTRATPPRGARSRSA